MHNDSLPGYGGARVTVDGDQVYGHRKAGACKGVCYHWIINNVGCYVRAFITQKAHIENIMFQYVDSCPPILILINNPL